VTFPDEVRLLTDSRDGSSKFVILKLVQDDNWRLTPSFIGVTQPLATEGPSSRVGNFVLFLGRGVLAWVDRYYAIVTESLGRAPQSPIPDPFQSGKGTLFAKFGLVLLGNDCFSWS
jgi:hypothetical protein